MQVFVGIFFKRFKKVSRITLGRMAAVEIMNCIDPERASACKGCVFLQRTFTGVSNIAKPESEQCVPGDKFMLEPPLNRVILMGKISTAVCFDG